MPSVLEDLEKWFEERPAWMRSALALLLQKDNLDDGDIKQLALNCKAEVGIQDVTHQSSRPMSPAHPALRRASKNNSIRLVAIHELKGINALEPRKPLEFGDSQLVVVYGLNASGKSGYIRLFKHASGQRNPGPLHHNVFSPDNGEQSCTFRCEIDGALTNLEWRKSKGPLAGLRGLQVYDTNCGSIYINAENEAAYEPFELTLLTRLTEACGRVSAILDTEILVKASRKPAMPAGLLKTQSALWYEKLNRLTPPAEIAQKCGWSDELEAELINLNQRLIEPNPSEKAKNHRKLREKLLDFYQEFSEWYKKLSDSACSSFLDAVRDSQTKRQAADDASKIVFAKAPLEGVGSETWKLLWQRAREYSEQYAYKDLYCSPLI